MYIFILQPALECVFLKALDIRKWASIKKLQICKYMYSPLFSPSNIQGIKGGHGLGGAGGHINVFELSLFPHHWIGYICTHMYMYVQLGLYIYCSVPGKRPPPGKCPG